MMNFSADRRILSYGRGVRLIFYLPHFLSWIVLGGILIDLLSSNGLLNRVLTVFGIEPILFLGSNAWFRPVVIMTNLWKEAAGRRSFIWRR